VTVAVTLRDAERTLEAAGIETAALDAELLFRHAAGWDRARLVISTGESVPSDVARRFRGLVAERARRTPLQHLTGRQAFWRHFFAVSPAVLIPRPETELLVEAALECLRPLTAPVVVDVGTGSGCIAVSIALERPDAHVYGVDLSTAALAVARENGALVSDRVLWREGDLLAPVAELAGRVDLVASNPPYIDPSERDALAPEVRDHEPPSALFAPGERYSVYRALIPQAAAALREGGWLLLEVGLGMADTVGALAAGAGLEVARVIPDLQSIPRTVVARRPFSPSPPLA
jgi:release factor glutamine methyltransferase